MTDGPTWFEVEGFANVQGFMEEFAFSRDRLRDFKIAVFDESWLILPILAEVLVGQEVLLSVELSTVTEYE